LKRAFKIFSLLMMACLVSIPPAWAQVVPMNQGRSETGSVTTQSLPSRPGSVAPLPTDDSQYSQVMAEGRARIHDGNVNTARNAALRMAYAEAVSKVAGMEIGALTIIRNVHKVSDVVMTRSKGFVKHYEIIREGLAESDPKDYEVVIRAEVLTHGTSSQDELDGLRLYLEILDNPTLLILLPERSVTSLDTRTNAAMSAKGFEILSGDTQIRIMETDGAYAGSSAIQPEVHDNELTLRGVEAAMAQAFANYGYRVMTSDELRANADISPEVIASARQGVTRDALTAAQAAGADLALVGGMRFSESMVKPAGVALVRVSAEVSAKAVVTSSERNLAIFHQTYLSAASDRLMAYTQAAHRAADGIADVLAWKIPQILAQESRETRLIIHGADYGAAEKVRRSLLRNAGIDDARLTRLPTEKKPSVEVVLLSSFVGLEPGDIIAICRTELGREVHIINGDRFRIELETKQ
jgi:hypothetical protein